jgi:hypothetical protein
VDAAVSKAYIEAVCRAYVAALEPAAVLQPLATGSSCSEAR